MPGRPSAPYGHHTPEPAFPRLRGAGGGASAARGVAAAVIAAATLILAANAGPARAADTAPTPTAVVQHARP
ncbi:hypothetical protein LK07_16330 [Streptomyces pluripotens]|uniref:Uncharacterized protein n=1 Tax=Streptomyces pluripotens TaxID=1355015 RepID=A0A221NZL1_9ACTN|nr:MULTISPECIES: hypothetical protein [Streptomyces]ARP71084.1 hypothetical protein LK06_015195 [Streptomyces pluripotens]ASN25332.1 hypothetical protein LK07_16330 [Streptomyces pluripotens]MCH0557142.1 hypothetical protein [Streptomyces sp. MUM 16J]